MSRTLRHGKVYCQVPGCRRRVERAAEIELPMAWEACAEYTVLTVVVGACRGHGHDLERRTRALLEARSEFPSLIHIIDGAVFAERELREQIALREAELRAVERAIEAMADQAIDAASTLRVARSERPAAAAGGRAS